MAYWIKIGERNTHIKQTFGSKTSISVHLHLRLCLRLHLHFRTLRHIANAGKHDTLLSMAHTPFKRQALLKLCIAIALCGAAHGQAPRLPDAPLPPARSSLPQLGLSADAQLTLSQERVLGRVLWRDLRSEPDLVLDPLVSDYVHSLIQRLAAPLGLPEAIVLRGFAVNDPALNAFAMPSGLMGVHSGLILSVAREGELAAVLAHEIGHVSQRHFARGLANQKDQAWIGLAGFAAALLAVKRGNAQADQVMQGVLVGSQAVQASKQLAFSRDMEREADAIGFDLMSRAQYDASDMVRMLRRLGAASSLNETGTVYAKSHPGVTERMATIEGRLRMGSVALQNPAANRLEFLLVQARLRALLAQSPEQIDDAKAVFEAAIRAVTPSAAPNTTPNTTPSAASSAAFARTAAQYGLALLALQAKQAAAAQALANQFAAQSHPWLDTLAFEIALSAPAALPAQSLAALIARHGASAVSHVAIQQSLKQGGEALSPADLSAAQAALLSWTAQRPHDDGAWESLAAVYALQNQPALASWAQAEQTAAMGVWASSIQLLSTALRMGETRVPIATQNQWRERLREFRQAAADEKTLLDVLK